MKLTDFIITPLIFLSVILLILFLFWFLAWVIDWVMEFYKNPVIWENIIELKDCWYT